VEKSDFTVLIVGLGLMGGSMAKALAGFKNCRLLGVDTDKDVLSRACQDGVIEKGFVRFEDVDSKLDLIILCIKPGATLSFLQNADIDSKTLVTDVCGVKGYLKEAGAGRNFRYIGGHPMAGREVGGYVNSDAKLFENASYLLTPSKDSKKEDIELLKEMASYIGCRKTVITTEDEHDQMIAYTSQLMHVVASALCDSPFLDRADGFSAGSLRDCTRVAKMDSKMWTELFMANKYCLTECIDSFTDSMNSVKTALINGDADGLHNFLENSCQRKRRYLNEDVAR